MFRICLGAIIFGASVVAVAAQNAAPPAAAPATAPATAPAAASTVYAILVGDTEDPTIGAGVTVNLNKVRSLLHQVRDEGHIAVVVSEVKDEKFNCTEILKAIRAVPVTANDAVIFYYAGHGFRRAVTQTQFPEFDCRRSVNSNDRADLSGVTGSLLKFGASGPRPAPRLVIAIADACNVVIEEQEIPRQASPRYARPNRGPAFRQLFLQYSGTLIMSGSPPGDAAWYLQTGGFFTSQLMNVVNSHALSLAEARWELIADDAAKPIFIPTATPTVQKPQFAPSNLQLAAGP